MPKAASTQAAPESFALPLDEFCARLSKEITAPELIGGFHHSEKVAGRLKDTEEAFRTRFASFGKKPV